MPSCRHAAAVSLVNVPAGTLPHENYRVVLGRKAFTWAEARAEHDAQFADYNLGQFVKAVESAYPGYFDRKLAAHIEELDTTSGAVIVNGMRSYTNIARAQDIIS